MNTTEKKQTWRDYPTGAVLFGAGWMIVLLVLMAVIMHGLRHQVEVTWDEKIASLMKQDIAVVIAKRLDDGATSNDLTCDQLKHYFDNRAIYFQIEKRIADRKMQEIMEKAPGDH